MPFECKANYEAIFKYNYSIIDLCQWKKIYEHGGDLELYRIFSKLQQFMYTIGSLSMIFFYFSILVELKMRVILKTINKT